MFTGLVQDIGTVERIVSGGMTDLWLQAQLPVSQLQLGESIACDGACLTVVETRGQSFRVQASPETLRRTTLGSWTVGRKVHLERALQLGDRLGGHLVLGHVDEVASVLECRGEADAWVMSLSLSPALAPFFIEKGSVTLDGVSLTVNSLQADRFSVALIPETQTRTTLAAKQPGSKVNVEADVIGKYVARLYGLRQGPGVNEDLLRRAGFTS